MNDSSVRSFPSSAERSRVNKPEIIEKVREMGASVVGFAPEHRWARHNEVPQGYHPRDIWSQTRSVIVFGVPMLLPIIESTPSINYQEMYDTSNRILDEISYRLAVWLTEHGEPSVCLPRDGYGSLEALLKNPFGCFSHTYAARYAGLGTVGLSHNLLTPDWGPRIRLNSVFTTAEFEGDPELSKDLCDGCGLCVRLCPASALSPVKGCVIGALDKEACTRHHMVLKEETRWPCGVCAKVCPIGKDRKAYDARNVKRYLEEGPALEKNPDDPRFRHLVHLRRHGSLGDRIC